MERLRHFAGHESAEGHLVGSELEALTQLWPHVRAMLALGTSLCHLNHKAIIPPTIALLNSY